jgi:hypothetical protein
VEFWVFASTQIHGVSQMASDRLTTSLYVLEYSSQEKEKRAKLTVTMIQDVRCKIFPVPTFATHLSPGSADRLNPSMSELVVKHLPKLSWPQACLARVALDSSSQHERVCDDVTCECQLRQSQQFASSLALTQCQLTQSLNPNFSTSFLTNCMCCPLYIPRSQLTPFPFTIPPNLTPEITP